MLEVSFRRAIEAVIGLASDRGIGPDMPTLTWEVNWMEPTSSTCSTGRKKNLSEPSYFRLNQELGSIIAEHPDVGELSKNVTEFVRKEGTPFRFFSPYESGTCGEILLQEYFQRVGRIVLDQDVISAIVTEFTEDLRSATAPARAAYLVQEFVAPQPFTLHEGITFRQITMADIDKYGRLPVGPRAPIDRWPNLNDWICLIERSVSKTDCQDFNSFHKDEIKDVVGALNLASPGRANFSLLDLSITSPFLPSARYISGNPIATSRLGGRVVLDSNALTLFRQTFVAVRRAKTESALEYLRLPLRRLLTAGSRQDEEDHLVDCVLGLERLLAPDTPAIESTFRFKLRGAALLPERFGGPEDRLKLMNGLYGMRSKIVHGGADQRDVTKYCTKAEEVLREILLWYLRHAPIIGNAEAVVRKIDQVFVTDLRERLLPDDPTPEIAEQVMLQPWAWIPDSPTAKIVRATPGPITLPDPPEIPVDEYTP